MGVKFGRGHGSTSCGGLNRMETTNSEFSYSTISLETAMYNAVLWVVANRITPTDLTVSVHVSPTGSTDALYYDSDYSTFCGFTWHGSGGSVIGLAKCDALTGSACDQHRVYFDLSAVNAADFDTTKERRLACHESGHVMGLAHTSDTSSCLSTSIVTTYSNHDVGIINATW